MEAAMMEYYRNNRNTTPEQTANKIADIAVMCQAYGIKKTFFYHHWFAEKLLLKW